MIKVCLTVMILLKTVQLGCKNGQKGKVLYLDICPTNCTDNLNVYSQRRPFIGTTGQLVTKLVAGNIANNRIVHKARSLVVEIA